MPILQLDDADLNYEVHGTGPTILFCAATATHGEVWKFHQVPDLSRDHRVVIFDQRGTGRSVARSTDYSNGRLAADAAALLDHIGGGSAVVCGHSNGGRVAQRLAVERPDLVRKLVLMSSGGASTTPGIPLDLCLGLVRMGYEPHIRDQAILNGFTADWAAHNQADLERYLAVRCGNPPSLEVFLRHVIGRQAFNLGARVHDIKAPTLVLIGDDEDHGPPGHMTHVAYAQQLAKDIPNARMEIMPASGHYYYFSAPELTNRLIRDFAKA